MDSLSKTLQVTRKVQNNIDRFETLSIGESSSTSRPTSAKSKISILDITSESSNDAGDTFSLRPSVSSSVSSKSTQSLRTKHKRHESTAFLEKSYLNETSPASLPDDAREILRNQPDDEDLAAVLQYLQYGINSKHDFNARIPSPKASQIISVLVTVTIPDQWARLRRRFLSKEELQLKKALLSTLSSVAGLGALLMQIRRLSSTSVDEENSLLEDMISVLASILAGSKVLSEFLDDAMVLFPSETSRRVFWQEVNALFAGSKLLSALSQLLASQRSFKAIGENETWLGDGPKYSRWLAKNISAAAVAINTSSKSDEQRMKMLCQVFKRALSLGYRGTNCCPSNLIAQHY